MHYEPRRFILGELNPHRDLNTPRNIERRRPIVSDVENREAVRDGVDRVIYDPLEVALATAYRRRSPPPARSLADSEDFSSYFTASTTDSRDSDNGGDDMDEPHPDSFHSGDTNEFTDPPFESQDDDGFHDLHDLHDEDLDGHQDHDDEHVDESEEPLEPVFDPASIGLKEINHLAHFSVSSHKPGNGVAELLDDDLDKYWQSDGQQPHHVDIHFIRRVQIRAMRFYVDYNQDESYTPTHIEFLAGYKPHFVHLSEMTLTNPVGWQDVPIAQSGGGADGHSLDVWVVRMQIKENHQNGKDTHIRGIKIYGLERDAIEDDLVDDMGDDAAGKFPQQCEHVASFHPVEDDYDGYNEDLQALRDELTRNGNHSGRRHQRGFGDLDFDIYTDFMRDPEIR
ncbi:anaphase-promoting complex, subunit 10-domain-containing protein [Apodospora peruviana]|uniref:Anaphase-promoting complex, subunit 10-domain-containing protein n=1 Tax=Apodospora peruviana TaxID=516989 RepID=A0AAE0M090_9PEZI|nr:anaphase-promoting complex, subunit 10-domain-containing protein [Apodospora peruviana]